MQELESTHQQLASVLQALQLSRQQIANDETKAWLQGPISAHQTQIALIDSVLSGLRTLAATTYPALELPEMPEEVETDVSALQAHLVQSAENMKATIARLPRRRRADAPAVTPEPVTEVSPTDDPDPQPRRVRREMA
jgi:hypothetical protein